MFSITTPSVTYPEPWNESFSDRLLLLDQGEQHVAYLYPKPNSGTFRYRVLNMIEALSATQAPVGATWFCADEISHCELILRRADVLVICHAKYSREFARVVALARARGKRVLYDVDDMVFDNRYVHVILSYLGHPTREVDMDYWFADIGRYGALMRLCDGVIVTNAYLADRVRDFCGLPTAVIPNFMNGSQLEHSRLILEEKRVSGFSREGRIHLGYFSGSPTHRRDFEVIEDALIKLMECDPRVVIRFVGLLEPSARLAGFGDRIEVFPFQNILNLQRLIGEVEFNLVPLQDNVFTNCKSELKVFEAAAVGTVSIVSPTFPLVDAIRNGATGYVAPAHRWSEVIGTAIGNLRAYPEMALDAAADCLQRYVPEAVGPLVGRTIFSSFSEQTL